LSSLLLRNIGCLISGKVDKPYCEGDAVLIKDGLIAVIGGNSLAESDADLVVDVQGATVAPGLIDSHVHPVLGDYTPRQKMLDFMESSLHGGVTTMISAGEPHAYLICCCVMPGAISPRLIFSCIA